MLEPSDRHWGDRWLRASLAQAVLEVRMWWQDLLWGIWNGVTAWIILLVHVFGACDAFPFYNVQRSGNWYDLGFLLGTGWPLLGRGAPSGRR